ncbi:hypothetical protein ACQHIH_21700 (plasmid) [Xanthomonas sontii]|uniref:hypothetical protein n=1 Tax=Xanthomonas sontii TaxID=2650745 RepID=UPI003F874276
MYVLDTNTGIVFHEPMPAQPACANGERLLPTDWRLLERLVRLLCNMDEPLTLEDAYARMGDEVEQMVVGIEPESELFDLTGPCGGLPLMSLPDRVRIVKHPVLPVFAVGVPVPNAVGGSDRTSLAVLRQ